MWQAESAARITPILEVSCLKVLVECAIYPIGWVSALSVPLATAKVTLCNMGGSRIGGDLGALAHLNPFMPKAKGLARCTALPSIENSLRAPFWGAVILYRSDIIRSFLLLSGKASSSLWPLSPLHLIHASVQKMMLDLIQSEKQGDCIK